MQNSVSNSLPSGLTGNLSLRLTSKRRFKTNRIPSIIPSPTDDVVYMRRKLADDL